MKRIPFHFFPLVQFDWPEIATRYLPGNRYNCTIEPRHDALFEKCKEWEKAGLIRIDRLTESQTFVTVKGD